MNRLEKNTVAQLLTSSSRNNFKASHRLPPLAAASKLFQSQLSWGFLINECLSEFSILFDFARCKEKQVCKGGIKCTTTTGT